MGRGGSCCGSEEEENEDEVDYDPANKGNADDKINKRWTIFFYFRAK